MLLSGRRRREQPDPEPISRPLCCDDASRRVLCKGPRGYSSSMISDQETPPVPDGWSCARRDRTATEETDAQEAMPVDTRRRPHWMRLSGWQGKQSMQLFEFTEDGTCPTGVRRMNNPSNIHLLQPGTYATGNTNGRNNAEGRALSCPANGPSRISGTDLSINASPALPSIRFKQLVFSRPSPTNHFTRPSPAVCRQTLNIPSST
ncbi:hypothetical protein CCHR01_14161 [Colletotrichum chrysophilum]|uniref:Uncharacterized protein n=1 Tax=Colletotrichum chrysophilum TaxID=1836956 RepID=A0AAD9A819_9PEZI|nr:hypothetical protein CCHR01_14161 [Colletotrichum chrysophilum]